MVSSLWDHNKAKANKLKLLDRLDYHRELSSQLEWQEDPGGRPVRVVYSSSGQPPAAVLADDDAIVDYTLFWVACRNNHEASYLTAVINSNALYEAVAPLMPKGLIRRSPSPEAPLEAADSSLRREEHIA